MMNAQTHTQTRDGEGIVNPTTAAPFIHKFKTQNHAYIFDVNTGEILRVDNVVWNIIEDSYLDKEVVIAKYASQFRPSEVAQAYDEIQCARAENESFLNWRPRIAMPWNNQEVAQLLDTSRTGLTLNVTERCNFRCTYCPYTYHRDGTPRHGERDMSWETAQAAVDDFLRHSQFSEGTPSASGVPVMTGSQAMENRARVRQAGAPSRFHVGFYGGEPLLNFPLVKRTTEYVLEKTTGKHVTFGISTNGYLLRGEVADFLGTHGFTVRVSVDGPAAIHDSQRRTVNGSPTWAVVMDNVRGFSAKYPHLIPNLGATLGPALNVAEAVEALAAAPWVAPLQSVSVALAEEPYPGYTKAVTGGEGFAGLKELHDRYDKNLVHGRLNLLPDDSELRLQRSIFSRIFRRVHMHRWGCAAARHGSGSMMPGGPCIPGADKLFVAVDGTYRLCEKAPEGRKYEFGDVFTGVDNDKAYRILEEFVDHTREQCGDCWCLPICSTGCYVSVSRIGVRRQEVTKAMKEQACEESRKNMRGLIVAYCHVLEQNPEAFDFFKLY